MPAPSIPPAKLPIVSQGLPAFASDNTFAPSRGNSNDYGVQWRSVTVPSVAVPQWLAYDISGLAAGQRANVLIALLNERGNLYYNIDTSQATLLFGDYKIQGNPAAGGGAAPGAGWVDLVTVAGNLYPTRHHLVNLTGYNWVRFACTASLGAAGNNDVSLKMDIHDASLGTDDRWLLIGDSITLECQNHGNIAGGAWGYGGAQSQVSSADANGAWYPAIIDAGNGGENMAWADTNKAGLLANINGGFVSIAMGTNDCNVAFLFVQGDANVTGYYTHLLSVIDAAIAAGAKVIVPYVPYGTANGGNLGANAATVNAYVNAHLPIDRPGVLRGPDFWTLMYNNQSLIRDGIHPTFAEVGGAPSGYELMHQLWGSWMRANVYFPGGSAPFALGNPRAQRFAAAPLALGASVSIP